MKSEVAYQPRGTGGGGENEQGRRPNREVWGDDAD